MKFSVEVDCEPQEAREFLGLPDVQAFQKSMMEMVQERMMEQLKDMDPEALMKNWMPTGMQAWEKMQESFMQGFTKTTADKSKT